PLQQSLEGGGLIRELTQLRCRHLFADDLGVRRALLARDPLAGDVVDAVDRAALFNQELSAGQEERQAEVYALTALRRIGHGAGGQVQGVGVEQRNASRRRRLLLRQLDRLADFLGDRRDHELLDQVDGEAHPLVVLVDVGEGRRARARPDREDAGLFDLVERRGLGEGRRQRREEQRQGQQDHEATLHRYLLRAK